MKTAIALVLATLPPTALAEVVYIQFDGVVVPGNSPMRDGYEIGDRVYGTLLIDTLLAPTPRADLDDEHPEHRFAWYGWPKPAETNFITGWAGDKEPRDFVQLDASRGQFVGLHEIAVADRSPYRTLFVRARHDSISLDLVQTFDIRQEEDNGELFGWFEWGREQIERVHFRMTRFSMTPGRCRP